MQVKVSLLLSSLQNQLLDSTHVREHITQYPHHPIQSNPTFENPVLSHFFFFRSKLGFLFSSHKRCTQPNKNPLKQKPGFPLPPPPRTMMSTARPPQSPTDGVDTAPFLPERSRRRLVRRTPSLRGAARFLRRASSRGMMREPSRRVREAAAEQIEERQSDWAYSRPIVILDLVWNLAFLVVSAVVLAVSRNESPAMPLRLWIVGYAVQCVLHMVCVSFEYRRRWLQQQIITSGDNLNSRRSGGGGWWRRMNSNSSSESDEGEPRDYIPERPQSEDETSLTICGSVAKHLESANTMFSFIWWIIGFYWVSAGGESLTEDSPQLYWLCITFLAFDVFFVVICVAVACVIGIAVCCCLPCIIALLYAVADQLSSQFGDLAVYFSLKAWVFFVHLSGNFVWEQEGATKEEIERLPKYRFRKKGEIEKQKGEIQESFGGLMTGCDTDSPIEYVLSLEDAECCICLCAYDDGNELRELPCRHHFHCSCIDKWLHINATCPLCKFNILKNGDQSGSEEV
ncbi:hypothetical protein RHGRI_019142 [Rhododendron griersonianum]|uniref:RING-type E3 ubiquitin transferase n=1 Tax=Rhododendron griersonianum TaxID=479676 RepID=A0AAV6JE88_9ERIC|nr:hypothetical protein RHGRI_019142 [Rhododendron griersonianum]